MNKIFVPFAIPIMLLIVWEILVDFDLLDNTKSASPSAILLTLYTLLLEGDILLQTLYSIMRLFSGVAVGFLFSMLSSYILYNHKTLDRFISPSLQFFAPIPIIIWIPPVIMMLGGGELFKIFLIGLSTFLLIHISAYNSMKEVNKEYLELSDIYEKSKKQKFLHILFPYSLSVILTTLRISVAIAWIVLFITEYSSASQNEGGLGYFISYARQMGFVEKQFSGVLILGILSYIVDSIIKNIQNRSNVWMNLELN